MYEQIGSIQSVHGLRGQVVIHFEDVKAVLPVSKRIFVYMYGTYVPYLIEDSRIVDGRAWVRFYQITTRSQAVRLQGHRVFVDKKDFVGNKEEGYESMVGRVVVDVHQGMLGKVVRVYERLMQPCLCVEYGNDELLIPLHSTFIQEVNEERVVVKLPSDYIDAVLGD